MAKMAEFPWPLNVSLKHVCGLRGYIMLYPTYGVAIVITIVITIVMTTVLPKTNGPSRIQLSLLPFKRRYKPASRPSADRRQTSGDANHRTPGLWQSKARCDVVSVTRCL